MQSCLTVFTLPLPRTAYYPDAARCLGAVFNRAVLAAALIADFNAAQATEIEPRAFSNEPVGLNFLIAGYLYMDGSISFDPAVPLTDAQIRTDSGILGYARALDVAGYSAKFDMIVPYTSLDGSALYIGQPRTREVSGFADPRFRFSINAETIRQAQVYGVRPQRLFQEAATKYLRENLHKRSIADDTSRLKGLLPVIGELPLQRLHDGTLQRYVNNCLAQGLKKKTVNNGLEIVRRILNLAARKWRDEYGLTWLETSPLLTMLDVDDARVPYPLNWEEQKHLLQALPAHLSKMALFKVNTGTREQEVCQLRWDWEIRVPELEPEPGSATRFKSTTCGTPVAWFSQDKG